MPLLSVKLANVGGLGLAEVERPVLRGGRVFWGEILLGEIGGEGVFLVVEDFGGLGGEGRELGEPREVGWDVGEFVTVVFDVGVSERDFALEVGFLGF